MPARTFWTARKADNDTTNRGSGGRSKWTKIYVNWENWKIYVIQCIKLNEIYISTNQAFSSYYKMRSIINRKDFMTILVSKLFTCIDLGTSQLWLLIWVWIKIIAKYASICTKRKPTKVLLQNMFTKSLYIYVQSNEIVVPNIIFFSVEYRFIVLAWLEDKLNHSFYKVYKCKNIRSSMKINTNN